MTREIKDQLLLQIQEDLERVTEPKVNLPGKKRDGKLICLKALAITGTVRKAIYYSGISKRGAYKAKETDLAFSQAWDDALDDAIDKLEEIAFNRARKGNDKLLQFILAGRRPEIYGRQGTIKHTGAIGINGEVKHEYDDDQLSQILQVLSDTGILALSIGEGEAPESPDS